MKRNQNFSDPGNIDYKQPPSLALTVNIKKKTHKFRGAAITTG